MTVRWTGVVADGETIHSDTVIIAGGAWSQAFGEQLGVRISAEPKRGQIIHLDLPGTDTSDWCVISAFRGHYIVPWADSRVAVGATRETGVGISAAHDCRRNAGGVGRGAAGRAGTGKCAVPGGSGGAASAHG